MTTTPAKAEANRRNALCSTGPKTAAGKSAASQNAHRHGILSREVLLPTESREDFELFRRRLWRALGPAGDLEGLLADRVVSSAWRLRRVLKVETETFESGSRGWKGEKVGLGDTFVSLSVNGDSFSKLSRYEAATERGLYRALHELQRLQASRSGQPVPPPVAVDVEISGTLPPPQD